MNEEEIYDKAMQKWSFQSQMLVCMEECGELIQALSHDVRQKTEESNEAVCEELADVEIMLAQMRRVYGNKNVDAHKARKLARLEELVK